MATLFHHSFSGRKVVLFLAEQAAVVPAALLGAAVAAALAAGDAASAAGAPLPRLLRALAGGSEDAGAALSAIARALAEGASARLPTALPWAVGAALGAAASLYAADLYNLRSATTDRQGGGRRTLLALTIAAVAVAVAAAPADVVGRGAALGAALAASGAVVLLRLALPAIVGRSSRVLVVGAGPRASAVIRAIAADGEAGLEVAGVYEPGAGAAAPGELLAAARRASADRIVVALEDGRGHLAADELVRCRVAGIPCFTPAMLYERALRRIPVDALRPSELAFSDGFRLSRGREATKRALDIAVAAIGVLLAAPVLLAAALAIRLGSPGPVFYRQERVGRHGRIFTITKLRTMRLDAEEAGPPRWAEEHDPRVTRVGRLLRLTRVDEIPQIFSVLAGDMSFVGPRPERPYFVEKLKAQIPWYGLREALRPGLTGWAQLRYPYGASVDDAKAKLEYDLYYLKNGSIFLDLAILFHTVRHVLTARGAR